MKTYPNDYRHYNYGRWEDKKNQPYDYARHGFFKHVMSHKIVESENETLQYLLKYLETSFINVMKFVERLKNFKNYAYTNR